MVYRIHSSGTKCLNVLVQSAFFILILVIGNCHSASSNHYLSGNNDASLSSLASLQSIQASNGGVTFSNLGNSFTIEPAYDVKCKEENTDDIEVCAKFSIGDEKGGFIYSPNYPNNYPNSTECARCIEAPHGRFIKLEFRDNFNMEESASCEYDKLEIRNGKFGYSDLLATLCGHDFPNEISSSDRFLWLRFKSDESIEYSGFKIYYQFIPLASPKPIPPKDCSDDIIGQSSGFISQENISIANIEYSNAHNAPLECVWTIEVREKNKYILEKPNDCEMNYIDIYEDNFNEEKRKMRFCGTSTEPFKSEGNKVRIRFHAKPGALKAKFSLLYTSFRETQNKEKCNPNQEFDCNDGTCIDIALKCNDEHNCKYRYDEDKALCQQDGSGLASLADNHMIVILVVFFALVIGMCASIIVSCLGKIQERRARELDYKMRVSSHPSLDAIDRINLVLGSKQQLPTSGYAAAQQQILNARYKQQLLMGSRNNSEEADADAMLDSLAKEEQEDEEEACYLPEMDGSLLILDESNSYSDQPHTHPPTVAPNRLIRGPPIVQHSLTSQNTDLVSPTDSCPLFYLHRPATAGSAPLPHHLLQQVSQQTESIKSGSNDSDSSIPPAPPPPKLSNRGLSNLSREFSREYDLRQRQIQSQRQTPVQQMPTSLMHHSPGSQPNLSKLVDNQQIMAGLAHSHLPQTHHYLPSHYRAISPTQAAVALADDLAYHQHQLHSAASHPYLNHQTASTVPRDLMHLSQHSLNHPLSLQQAQYNSSKQRLIQSQSSQQSDSPNAGQQNAALLHHPDCAAVIRPKMVSNNTTHFYSTHGSPIRHTPSHKQTNLNKQMLDEPVDVDLQQFSGGRQAITMHNQSSLFGMSRPSNMINSSQEEERESDLGSITNHQQTNGQMIREIEYNEDNGMEEDEDELQGESQTQQLVVQQQQLIRNRPQLNQFRQMSSNSNNDSNESAMDQSPIGGPNHTNAGVNDDEKKHHVPLTNRLQQQLINKNYGSKMNENNFGGQQTSTGQTIGGSNIPNNQAPPSQQILQRTFSAENRPNCGPDVVMRNN